MFEDQMDGKDIHVLKKAANSDPALRVEVPGKRDHATLFSPRIHIMQ